MIFTVIIYCVFAVLLIVAAVTDVRTLRIPNALIVIFAALWVVWRVVMGIGSVIVGVDFGTGFLAPASAGGVSFADGIVGAIVLGGVLLVVTAIYEMVTKKPGLGGGDIKLLTVVGLFLGVERGVLCLLVACVVSLILAPIASRRRWGNKSMVLEAEADQPMLKDFPFGPAIAVGTFIALLVL